MINLFDYVFYRVYKFYQKRDGSPAMYASKVLSLIQFLVILCILTGVKLMLEFNNPHKLFVIPLILGIMVINWYRYERDFDVKILERKWSEEPSAVKKRNGWLIMFGLILLLLFPIVIGILKHNLGAI